MEYPGRSEGVAGSDVSKANQGVHEGQLSWVVELGSGNASSARKHGGLCQVMELASVNKAFQDVLPNIKTIVANGRDPLTEFGEVFNGLFNPMGGHVILAGPVRRQCAGIGDRRRTIRGSRVRSQYE
jgi:hypothetical protein